MRNWVVRGAPLAAAICMAAAAATAQEATPNDKRPIQLAQAQVQVKTTPLQVKTTPRAPTAASSGESNLVAKVNNWTVGLAGGLPEGTFLRFAAEISRNLNDTDDLRVLAVVTPGATDNVKDLLYLKGMDIAITHADVFEHFRNVEKIPNIEKRVHFISEMYISELHVLVRPEINSFKDLEGKKVSFHTPGAGPSVTGPILFQRLGVKVEPVYINNAIAYEKMKTGEIAALIHTVGKPNDLFTKNKNDSGFKFLAVPFDKFEDFYVPSVFTAEDYPGYVKPGEKVETLGVQAVLAVYNWPRDSDRFRRVSRFIDFYFDRFKKFHEPPYHPKWKSINLAAKVPGWTRFWVAEEKLKQMAAAQARDVVVDNQLVRQQAARAAPNSAAEQERLFQQFLEWSKSQGKQ
jgi:TRAP transporter TAXI family solute receptor